MVRNLYTNTIKPNVLYENKQRKLIWKKEQVNKGQFVTKYAVKSILKRFFTFNSISTKNIVKSILWTCTLTIQ